MHTRAAFSQTFHEHLLAYVKQDPPRASLPLRIFAGFSLALATFACATLPRTTTRLSLKPTTDSPVTTEARIGVNINTATERELETLPGIGKGIAERIIAHREQYGAFRRAEHLMMVRGISEQKFRELLPMIRVD
jgi:competence ComEA-like helix-hairpin-helix protein